MGLQLTTYSGAIITVDGLAAIQSTKTLNITIPGSDTVKVDLNEEDLCALEFMLFGDEDDNEQS